MFGIRQKLIVGFGSLLAVIVVIGLLNIRQIEQLGQSIDVILKENYRSVVACQDMKESLERMDSGILYTLSGKTEEGNLLIDEYASSFRIALGVEMGNVTLPSEREKSQRIKVLFEEYLTVIPQVTESNSPLQQRQTAYFGTLQPLFQEIKTLAQDILVMNQTNMSEANNSARRLADTVHRRMLAAIAIAALIAALFSYLTHRWILRPINRLLDSTKEIRLGNLDLVLEAASEDEVGRLSESFNEMTAVLRQVRDTNKTNLIRTRRVTEDILKALPVAIAVLDLDGRVELSTETADRHFGLKPGVQADELGYEWLSPLIRKALAESRVAERDPKSGYIQQFIDNREYFFQPMVVPILAGKKRQAPTGTALILKDVTQIHEQQELKRGVVSTVSHQLKTPLTSLRMSVHLLLEERVGPLNEKQSELLIAAREDSERLVGILDDLLNLNRITAGESQASFQSVPPRVLVRDSLEPLVSAAKDKGITMTNVVQLDLPEVMVDVDRIHYVFTNLLANALRFTDPGGAITVRAGVEPGFVRFFVEDTGAGIDKEHLGHLFEQFYRAPGQDEKSGIGLGLSIVREIIQAHGGDVSVESRLGEGSIFSFLLPLTTARDPEENQYAQKGDQ